MSTKTTIKRIALVAAVAAAFGGLSTVAANASAPVTAGTAVWTQGSFGTGTVAASNVAQVVGGLDTLNIAETVTADATLAGVIGTITTSGVGSIVSSTNSSSSSAAVTVTTTGGSVAATYPTSSVSLYATANAANGSTLYTEGITLSSSVAGTQTVTFTPISATGAPGTAVTATITWGAAPTVSTQYSVVGAGQTASTLDQAYGATPSSLSIPTTAPSASDAAGTLGAYIFAQPYNSSDAKLASEKLTFTITSGPGTLIALQAPSGSAPTLTAVGRSLADATGGLYETAILADGTAGTSTVTVSDGTVLLGTVTVVFTGSASKVTATQNLKVLKAGGVANGQHTAAVAATGNTAATAASDGAAGDVYSGSAVEAADSTLIQNLTPITAFTTDASGNPVTITASSSTIKVVSSDSTVLTAGTCSNATVGSDLATNEINCYVLGTVGAASGKSATATVELWDATTSAWDIVSAPLTFTIGGAVTKEVVTTDAASYSPAQPIVLTVTATDKAGNAAYDQDGPAIASLVSSVYMNGLVSPAHIIGGVGTVKTGIYAPSVEGDFTISGLDNLSAASEAVSVTATVADGAATTAASAATDAANEATDAANAATDAANAAADAADAATSAAQDASAQAQAALAAVNALSAKITVLAAQIAKIVKKIKA